MLRKGIVALLVLSAVAVSQGAGFGLYEASARGNALGGTLVGSTRDASAVYYNPANMTEMTNVSVMVGATLVGLYADVNVDGSNQSRLDPGLFCIPNLYATVPLFWDFTFGFGIYCEDGLGTKYDSSWPLAGDTTETTMEQFTFNPALAYKITDWWSIAGGIKMSYIYFYNQKHPYAGTLYPSAYGLLPNMYHLRSELEGDDVSIGYDFGTTFRFLDDFALGIVYRSQIEHDIRGDYDLDGRVGNVSMSDHSDAGAKLTLPQSITAGLNWDTTDDLRLGVAATWTQWSCVDTIDFRIPAVSGGGYSLPLKWNDVWRFAVGAEYDITDSWSVRGAYIFDMDPSNRDYGTTMLPSGDRHILGIGFGWYIWRTLRLDVGYNIVYMCNSDRDVTVSGAAPALNKTYHFEISNAWSHMISASLSYVF